MAHRAELPCDATPSLDFAQVLILGTYYLSSIKLQVGSLNSQKPPACNEKYDETVTSASNFNNEIQQP